MKSVKYILTPNTLNVQLEGAGIYVLSSDDVRFSEAIDMCRAQNFDGLVGLLDKNQQLLDYFREGNFEVRGRSLYYKDEFLDGFVAERAIEFIRNGLPHRPLLRFIERLLQNPSKRAIQELYTFLEHKSLPITDDGYFLAYKSVREDYMDFHSGKFSNHVGARLTMPRSHVNDDAREGCSAGFHAGSLQYAAQFGAHDPGRHMMIVRIDPKDVVSVPFDHDCQKLRTSEYLVVDEYRGELPDYYVEGYEDYDDPEEVEDWEETEEEDWLWSPETDH